MKEKIIEILQNHASVIQDAGGVGYFFITGDHFDKIYEDLLRLMVHNQHTENVKVAWREHAEYALQKAKEGHITSK